MKKVHVFKLFLKKRLNILLYFVVLKIEIKQKVYEKSRTTWSLIKQCFSVIPERSKSSPRVIGIEAVRNTCMNVVRIKRTEGGVQRTVQTSRVFCCVNVHVKHEYTRYFSPRKSECQLLTHMHACGLPRTNNQRGTKGTYTSFLCRAGFLSRWFLQKRQILVPTYKNSFYTCWCSHCIDLNKHWNIFNE